MIEIDICRNRNSKKMTLVENKIQGKCVAFSSIRRLKGENKSLRCVTG